MAKYRSFTRAAAALHGSQPNITRTINLLEQELGCRLFERSHRGVALTPEGEQLFSHVQIMQEQMQAAESELASRRSLHSGRVAIGASETALHGLLLPVLRDFKRRYPGVRLQITNHSTPPGHRGAALGAGGAGGGGHPLRGAGRPAGRAAAAPLSRLAGGRAGIRPPGRPAPDLWGTGPAAPDLPGDRTVPTFAFYARLLAENGAVLEPDVQTATTDQLVPLVRYGLGLAFVPEDFAGDALAKGEVVRLTWKRPRPCAISAW